MGRTKRKRLKRKCCPRILNMNNDPTTINLTRWLTQNNWQNHTHLKLGNFPQTGRGVTSSKLVEENDILITVPYDVMITYTTLQENLQEMISPGSHGLKIHDLLTLFLVIEKQKENSLWRSYMDSLPAEFPILPWLATSEEINLYPRDLQIASDKNRENFMGSMSRLKKSIKKHDDRVLDENLFKWGYVLVNTRAVYVDPQITAVEGNFLIDQPSMALCPFLDMFNHHFLARTEASVVDKDGKLFYQLRTLTKYQKYSQIFISYGAHDNIKLLMEYGFFIPGNTLDVVKFELQALFEVLHVNLDQRRYKFITQHNLQNDLYIGYTGLSFNLKAVLFIFFFENCSIYNTVIFSDNYPEDFLTATLEWMLKLLDYKLNIFEKDYEKLRDCTFEKSENAKLAESFLQYRVLFVTELKYILCEYVDR